ncbi:hypothetical protein, partial [Escherichia coli]|uniref:hypothetical protein n=1 Tax=Escherichia coli TaxID=562 RepID=UPI0015E2CB2B
LKKITNKGAENTYYDSWLDMYIEIKSKGLSFSAKWGCFVGGLIELHTRLLKLKTSDDESTYLFFPEEGMLKLIFGKNNLAHIMLCLLFIQIFAPMSMFMGYQVSISHQWIT